MSPRPDVSTERKNQILNAAMRVFARRGFHKARMDDIAAESHLSKGALYLYFRSKDAIIQALARKLFDVELRALRRAASERRPAPARLRALARHVLDSISLWQPFLPVLHEFYAFATRPGPVRTALQDYYRQYSQALAALITEGIERGELCPGDPNLLARTVIAQFEGLLLLWVVAPQTFDLSTQWLPMAEHLIHSMETCPSKEKSQ